MVAPDVESSKSTCEPRCIVTTSLRLTPFLRRIGIALNNSTAHGSTNSIVPNSPVAVLIHSLSTAFYTHNHGTFSTSSLPFDLKKKVQRLRRTLAYRAFLSFPTSGPAILIFCVTTYSILSVMRPTCDASFEPCMPPFPLLFKRGTTIRYDMNTKEFCKSQHRLRLWKYRFWCYNVGEEEGEGVRLGFSGHQLLSIMMGWQGSPRRVIIPLRDQSSCVDELAWI